MNDGKNQKPIIDQTVDEKIDDKIQEAKLPPGKPLANAPSKTTIEEDLESAETRAASALKTSGQRKINLIWEATQGAVAFSITIAVIYCDVNGIKTENIGKAFILVVALYFIRTNHTKTGGIGGTDSR